MLDVDGNEQVDKKEFLKEIPPAPCRLDGLVSKLTELEEVSRPVPCTLGDSDSSRLDGLVSKLSELEEVSRPVPCTLGDSDSSRLDGLVSKLSELEEVSRPDPSILGDSDSKLVNGALQSRPRGTQASVMTYCVESKDQRACQLKNIIGKTKEVKMLKDDMEDCVNESPEQINTTLLVYLFGRAGNQKLQYQEFQRFMEDLQAEMQEMEFMQFSKGMGTMRREDFAEWLLHYTNEEDNEAYWENMRKRIPPGQSISFEEFKSFCLFTNNMDDFAFTMKMISEANRPIKMAEFKRAVMIATGHELSESVLDTVFKIFDLDGDNCLSHKEFLGVMNDRIQRGLKVQPQQGIQGYWKCVKRETLKGAQEALRQTGRSPF
ncbi:MICU2 protein, partial [Polyodon spathula]|nr:MICU2 protein [Polyodon spathula]